MTGVTTSSLQALASGRKFCAR